ncbi:MULTISPECIES: hypothetical protein [unclassified Streptomyces]|uniref:hypothetical protein n=1 Tax=unclassified Streptomyces TaxID=2593676 RepID=UPI002DD942BC|nr:MULTISPECIES: hypothetical protein [unclassified Streptomyces]WSC45050.1 hypothetical protein OIE61_14400 [Streptomyces sp. NBC_01762]WSD24710.1 hypothetical protein OHA26_15135 [Streptomyces sp. NBC_01751]
MPEASPQANGAAAKTASDELQPGAGRAEFGQIVGAATLTMKVAITATGIRNGVEAVHGGREGLPRRAPDPRTCGLPECRIMAYTPADEENGAGGDAAPTP